MTRLRDPGRPRGGAESAAPDEAAVASPGPLLRASLALRRPENWLELARFSIVGGSGYVLNVAVFAAAVHGFGLHYRLAAVIAFLLAVANNFWWNRHWTFTARDGPIGFQARRFFIVSVAAFAVSLIVLDGLVRGAGLSKLLAEAIAVASATPIGFLGNRLWSFPR
ncbi:MAG: hypothetical protein QOF04_578 [Solirubrobacteraceae bacterium]|nr:hypothetical protein [Solirubrobacteraceae bacterium]